MPYYINRKDISVTMVYFTDPVQVQIFLPLNPRIRDENRAKPIGNICWEQKKILCEKNVSCTYMYIHIIRLARV